MRAKTNLERDEIAARQAWLLNQHLGPPARKIRTHEVRELFQLMRDEL